MSKKNDLFSDLSDSDFSNLISKLTNIAMAKTLNKFDAEDLVNTAFKKALESQDSFSRSDNSSLDAWMITILKNSFIDLTRKKKELQLEEPPPEIEIHGEQDLSYHQKMLRDCIGKLDQINREIVSLVELGESYAYIAEVLSLSVENLRKRICLARKDLVICLEN